LKTQQRLKPFLLESDLRALTNTKNYLEIISSKENYAQIGA
jgi:hypothetical protein